MIADQSVQVVAVNAIRDGVRDAELDPAEALDLLLAAAPRWDETPGRGRARVCHGHAGRCRTPRSPSARSGSTGWRAVADQLLSAAPEGSDAQLVAFRLLVRSTARRPSAADLAGRASACRPGIVTDPELVWLIVERLAVLDPDPSPIEAALARDRSAAGRIHATRARAALGRPEAKVTAWARLVEPSNLTAYELYATAEGFFVPGQEELTDPYVDRYFAEIGATGAFRSGWALRDVAAKAYPGLAATPDDSAAGRAGSGR